MSTPGQDHEQALILAALRASTDQYGAGLRDLADANPQLGGFARVMAQVILMQYPDADGRVIIAAAQAANGAIALAKRDGGELGAQSVTNLIFLAGRAITEGEVQP